ncbi:hypothetical protein D3C87_961660 [compost metagenome]
MFCVWGLENQPIIKRQLLKDSLHTIKYQNIRNILAYSKNRKDFKNSWKELHPIMFIFENDTIADYNIQKLLNQIDSLGFHRYNIRRIAPFEKKVL